VHGANVVHHVTVVEDNAGEEHQEIKPPHRLLQKQKSKKDMMMIKRAFICGRTHRIEAIFDFLGECIQTFANLIRLKSLKT
jgi:hypothetical protein